MVALDLQITLFDKENKKCCLPYFLRFFYCLYMKKKIPSGGGMKGGNRFFHFFCPPTSIERMRIRSISNHNYEIKTYHYNALSLLADLEISFSPKNVFYFLHFSSYFVRCIVIKGKISTQISFDTTEI